MGETELLDMLASETDRRSGTIVKGVQKLAKSGKSDPARVEELRVEAHGLKGAAMVVGQERLAQLALGMEEALASRAESGQIDPEVAEAIVGAINALHDGTQAAANGAAEPPSVGESIRALGA
jgi:chemotaxis protein histidine kinase CheA